MEGDSKMEGASKMEGDSKMGGDSKMEGDSIRPFLLIIPPSCPYLYGLTPASLNCKP